MIKYIALDMVNNQKVLEKNLWWEPINTTSGCALWAQTLIV